MNKLIVLLPSGGPLGHERLHCWQCDVDGSVKVVAMGIAEMAQAKGAQVRVVVPQVCLSWHRITLPSTLKLKGDARLLPVLQNLLEEVLLDDVEQMHLALAPQAQAGQPCIVAACSKAWLGGWLQAMESAGLKVAQVLPQVAPDVLGDGALGIEHAHGAWLVLQQDGLPLCVPAESDMPALAQLSHCETQPAIFNEVSRSLGVEKVHLSSDQHVQQLLQNMLATRWDLAQHGFASRTSERLRRKVAVAWQDLMTAPAWRSARWALVCLAGVWVVGINAQSWWQQHLLREMQASLIATVQKTFPQLQVIVDAPLQMQREVERLRESAGVLSSSDFQPLAAAVGSVLQISGLQASHISYDAGGLKVRAAGLSAHQAAAWSEHLQSHHYRAEWVGDAMLIKEQP